MIPALHLPVGVTPGGDEVAIDLLADPHLLISGDTTSRVRAASAAVADAAARAGHRVAAITDAGHHLNAEDVLPSSAAVDVLSALTLEADDRRRRLRLGLALHWAGLPGSHAPPPVTVVVDEVAELHASLPVRDQELLVHYLSRLAAIGGPVGIYLHLTQAATDLPLPAVLVEGVTACVWAGGVGGVGYRPERLGRGDVQAVVTRDGLDRCVLIGPVRSRPAA